MLFMITWLGKELNAVYMKHSCWDILKEYKGKMVPIFHTELLRLLISRCKFTDILG